MSIAIEIKGSTYCLLTVSNVPSVTALQGREIGGKTNLVGRAEH